MKQSHDTHRDVGGFSESFHFVPAAVAVDVHFQLHCRFIWLILTMSAATSADRLIFVDRLMAKPWLYFPGKIFGRIDPTKKGY